MTLTEQLTTSKNALDGALRLANSKTGVEDTNICDAVHTLIDGYGQGGGGTAVELAEGSLKTFSDDNIYEIRPYLFYQCSELAYCDTNNVKKIGSNAFNGCSALRELNFPELTSLDYNGSYYFAYCNSLINVVLPKLRDGVFNNSSGATMFTHCENLESVSLPSLVEMEKGNNSSNNNFSYCPKLKIVEMPSLTWFAGYTAFTGSNNLERVQFGTLIGKGDFGSVWNGLPKLIDIELGTDTDIDLNFRYWNPSSVLSDGDKVELLNSNIKNHIVLKLKDNTGLSAKTITFCSAVYNVLASDTLQSFCDRNWNIESV